MVQDRSSDTGVHRRKGNQYIITQEEIDQYNNLGYLVLDDVLLEEEMNSIDPWFEHFVSGKEIIILE